MSSILVVAKRNSYGLSRHGDLLSGALEACGHQVEIVAPRSRGLFDRFLGRRRADIAIHLERISRPWISAATVNWLMPMQERFPERMLPLLPHIDGVLANTRDAEQIFASKGIAVHYTGFTSVDRHDPGVVRDWNRFIHLAGASTLKGTEAILDLWGRHPEWPELVLVQVARNAPSSLPGNVRLLSEYLDDAELRRLQNHCGVHLCPSLAEGWGHYIVEALSVGAVTLVTDAPPMNEHVDAQTGVPVRWDRSEARHLGRSYHVDRQALEGAIARLIAMPDSEKAAMGARARARFQTIDRHFRETIGGIVTAR